MRTQPASASINRYSASSKLDLPEPVRPTMPTCREPLGKHEQRQNHPRDLRAPAHTYETVDQHTATVY